MEPDKVSSMVAPSTMTLRVPTPTLLQQLVAQDSPAHPWAYDAASTPASSTRVPQHALPEALQTCVRPCETFPGPCGPREIFDPGLRVSPSTLSEARTICSLDPSEWVNKVTQSAQASLHASTKDPRGEPRPVDPTRARSIFNDVIAISASKLQEASDTQHEILQASAI